MTIAIESALSGRRTIWGAPIFDQTRISMDETRHALGDYGEFNQSRMSCTLPTGGSILYRSLDDPRHLKGHTADLAVIDEGGAAHEAAWYESLRPMLITTNGIAWIVGTPNGRNYFWKEHIVAPDKADSMAWTAPTVGCEIIDGQLVRRPHPLENPDVPFSEIISLFETMSERAFRQEILAEFVEDGGGVFRRVRERAIAPWPVTPYQGDFVFGLDWAQKVDFTVLIVMDRRTRRVVDMDRFNRVDWSLQRGRVRTMADKWRPITIWAESNSIGGPNIEALQADGLPVHAFDTTPMSKPPLIESLALAFERGEISIPDQPVLIGELEAYERKVSAATGRSQFSAPAGLHDDCVIALALAWSAVLYGGMPAVSFGGSKQTTSDQPGALWELDIR